MGSKDDHKISETPAIKIKEPSLLADIWYYFRRVVIFTAVAATMGYAAYWGTKEFINLYDQQQNREEEYRVYKQSLCDLLSAKGLANRECNIPFEKMIDSNYPKDIERVLNSVLLTSGIKADLKDVHAFANTDDIFKKITFYKLEPSGSVTPERKAPLADVSSAVNKYLQKR